MPPNSTPVESEDDFNSFSLVLDLDSNETEVVVEVLDQEKPPMLVGIAPFIFPEPVIKNFGNPRMIAASAAEPDRNANADFETPIEVANVAVIATALPKSIATASDAMAGNVDVRSVNVVGSKSALPEPVAPLRPAAQTTIPAWLGGVEHAKLEIVQEASHKGNVAQPTPNAPIEKPTLPQSEVAKPTRDQDAKQNRETVGEVPRKADAKVEQTPTPFKPNPAASPPLNDDLAPSTTIKKENNVEINKLVVPTPPEVAQQPKTKPDEGPVTPAQTPPLDSPAKRQAAPPPTTNIAPSPESKTSDALPDTRTTPSPTPATPVQAPKIEPLVTQTAVTPQIINAVQSDDLSTEILQPLEATGSLFSPEPILGSKEMPITAGVRIDHAPRVMQMMMEAAKILPDRPVELTLSPEELGRVRMTLQATDGGMNVVVAVERPETLELLRRNVEQLAAELRELGYKDVSFEFANQNDAQEQQNSDAKSRDDPTVNGPINDVDQAQQIPLKINLDAATGVDIRL